MAVIRVSCAFCLVAAFVVGLSAPLAGTAFGAVQAGHGDGSGKGHAKQVTDGRNTANTPAIASGPRQISAGRRNVNAPAGNNSIAFTGLQQVTSVSVFTDTLSGRCVDGVDDCGINQNVNARRQKAR